MEKRGTLVRNVFYKKSFSYKCRNIYRKRSLPDSLLNKIAEICQSKEFLRTPVLKNIYKTAVSVSNKFKKFAVTKG